MTFNSGLPTPHSYICGFQLGPTDTTSEFKYSVWETFTIYVCFNNLFKIWFKHVLGHLSDPISTWDFGVFLVLVLTTADHPQYFTFSVSLSFQFFKFKKHCSIWATPYGCANSSKHKNTGQVYLDEFLQSLPIYHGFHPWDCVFPKRFFCLILTKVM